MKTETEQTTKRGRHAFPDGTTADSFLHLRVQRTRKASYVRAASAQKMKLSAWVIGHLDRAARYSG